MPSCDLELALRGVTFAVRKEVPLAPLTHLRVGGPAEWFLEPFHEADAALAVRACRDADVPLRVLGGGSNLLVADAGVRGAVLHLGRLNRIVREGNRVTAGAGVTLPSLLRATKEVGLAGLEKLTGIPAHVGGAVAMNAGTRDGETFEFLTSLTVLDRDGNLTVLPRAACKPVYRDARLGELIVLSATFELQPDDPKAIFERFTQSLKKRNATQPVTEHSAGCVFRNPPGDAAGRLIEAAGAKTMRQGDIVVSGLHANYFLNEKAGTARDFLALLERVRELVFQKSGVRLEPEVKLWGFPG